MYGNKSGPLEALYFDMRLSPFTDAVDPDAANEARDAAWNYLATNNPVCGARWRLNNEPVPASIGNGSSCPEALTINPVVSYLALDNVSYYDHFVDGGERCGEKGGQYFQYDGNLTVTCLPCPENTFRPAEERAKTICDPCANGTVAPVGSISVRSLVDSDGVLSFIPASFNCWSHSIPFPSSHCSASRTSAAIPQLP